jgi:hypothetical protein
MKRIRMLGLCVVAACAMSALGATSASALEYKTCIKSPTDTGNFTEKACVAGAPGNGEYELGAWNQGKKHTFKGKASHPVNYLVNPIEPTNTELNPLGFPKGAVGFFTATGSKSAGELTGPSTSTFTEEFKGVKSEGKNCNSPGEGKGKIKTFLLGTTLVPLAAGSGQAEEVYSAASPGTGLLAEFECEGLGNKDHGAVIAEIVGASGGATKTFSVHVSSRGGNPNNLQEFMKAGGTGSAAEEEGATDAIEIGACIKHGAKSPGECAATYGDAETFEPATLIDAVTGSPAGSLELPAAQNGTSAVKGEAIKIG